MNQQNTNNQSDTNIEDKVKNIITKKLQNNKFKKELNGEEMVMIEKLFELFPDLKEKTNFTNNSKVLIQSDEPEIVLDEIKINNIIHYLDSRGGIWNANSELIGVYTKSGTYHFFDKKYNLDTNLNNILL